MTIQEAREKAGLTRTQMCELFKLPYRTLQSWELGDRKCPEWAEMLILEKLEGMNMKTYYVVENKNVGTIGHPEFYETVIWSGTKAECVAYENERRKTYKDTTKINCWTVSAEEYEKQKEAVNLWDNLSDDDKKDIIEVDGKKYIRKIWERNHGKM